MNRRSPALAIGLCLALFACGRPSPTPSGKSAPTPPPGRKLHLAFVTNNAAPSWAVARAGCNKAAAGLPNVTLDFQMVTDGTAATQKRIVDDLLARNMDGIAISPVDPEGQAAMLADATRQTLLVTQDRDAAEGSRACYIGADNPAAGRQAGELIREALPNGGQIAVLVGAAGARPMRDRLAALKAALAGSSVEIVAEREDDGDPARARVNAVELLTRQPPLAGLVGLSSHHGAALIGPTREAKPAGVWQLVCADETDETLQAIRDGVVFGTVVPQPFEHGRQAIALMSRTLNGDKAAIPPDGVVLVPTKAVKEDGVDAFAANLRELRGH